MLTYRFTPEAKHDLEDIRRYTNRHWGMEQSKIYLQGLRQVMQQLVTSPGIGIKREDLGNDIFSFQYQSHLIYYTCNATHLVVFGVLHKRMVPTLHLNDRGHE